MGPLGRITSLGRILVIGNVTKDIIIDKNGEIREDCGGTIYSSTVASRLGYESHLLTEWSDDIIECMIRLYQNDNVRYYWKPGMHTTTFENDYSTGKRKQRLLKDTLTVYYPSSEDVGYLGKFDIIFLNPMFHEISPEIAALAREDCELLVLDVQGLVRKADMETKEVSIEFWDNRDDYLRDVDILKVGMDEVEAVSKMDTKRDICKDLYNLGADIVALTYGINGSMVYDGEGDNFHKIPAFRTGAIDETGAGDVYTTALGLRYFETKNLLESALFASAAASFVVEDYGPESIAPREKVEERCEILKEKIL